MNIKRCPCKDCGGRCMKNVSFLTAFPAKNQLEITDYADFLSLKKGEYLFRSGETIGDLFFIRSGMVKFCSIDSEGREQVISIHTAGDAIWEGLFFRDNRYFYCALCTSAVQYYRINQCDIEAAITDTNRAMQVVHLLSQKLQDANQRNLIFTTHDPSARIAGFLLYAHERSQSDIVSMRLNDIAAFVNLRPETVSRKLSEFQKAGYIKRTSKSQIQISDIDALSEVFGTAQLPHS